MRVLLLMEKLHFGQCDQSSAAYLHLFDNTVSRDLNKRRLAIIYTCLLNYFYLDSTKKIKHNQFQLGTLLESIKDNRFTN